MRTRLHIPGRIRGKFRAISQALPCQIRKRCHVVISGQGSFVTLLLNTFMLIVSSKDTWLGAVSNVFMFKCVLTISISIFCLVLCFFFRFFFLPRYATVIRVLSYNALNLIHFKTPDMLCINKAIFALLLESVTKKM